MPCPAEKQLHERVRRSVLWKFCVQSGVLTRMDTGLT
jgi:hypothetical protein